MLFPKKVKYKKMHLSNLKGIATKNNSLTFGTYGFQAITSNWISSKQIEVIRKLLIRHIKKVGKLWIKIFPQQSITLRASESRMGSGKGNVSHWVSIVKVGTILFEVDNLSKELVYQLFNMIKVKLPVKLKLICKNA